MTITIHGRLKPNEILAHDQILKESNGRYLHLDEFFHYGVSFDGPEGYTKYSRMMQEYNTLTKPITEKKPASFFKKIARRLIGEYKSLKGK